MFVSILNDTLAGFWTLGFLPGIPGPVEMLIIGVVALLLFGKYIPPAMKSLGQSIVAFRKGISEGDV